VTTGRILIVDDDRALCETLGIGLRRRRFEVESRASVGEAIDALAGGDFDAVVTDLNMGGSTGIDLCVRIVARWPDVPVLVLTAFGSMETAVQAIRAGAYDFINKPVELDVLGIAVDRAVRNKRLHEEVKRLRDEAGRAPTRPSDLVGDSDAVKRVVDLIARVADAEVTVLVTGESGTGKELVARALHARSRRSGKPFVAVNCAAVPEGLLESELFGHARGAFTDAKEARVGLFQQASGGTLFLDEIGDMPMPLQPKLLRVLQERTVRPVGTSQEVPVDVRIVCATNRDLSALIAQQQFRQDLYYRIAEVTVQVPAVRERAGGAVLLAHAMLRRHASQAGRSKRGFTEDALAAIDAYAWPGNVREIENKVKAALIMADGPLVTAADLGLAAGEGGAPLFTLKDARARAELGAVRQALQICDGQITRAAEMLGITRPTLYELMDRYKLRRPAP